MASPDWILSLRNTHIRLTCVFSWVDGSFPSVAELCSIAHVWQEKQFSLSPSRLLVEILQVIKGRLIGEKQREFE